LLFADWPVMVWVAAKKLVDPPSSKPGVQELRVDQLVDRSPHPRPSIIGT
jgi:hypothetical protein